MSKMKKTTAKNSFICYFKSAYYGVTARTNTDSFDILTIVFSMYLFGFVLGILCFSGSDGVIRLNIGMSGCALAYVSICVMGIYLRRSPALFNFLPISYKKRTVYFYLSALLGALIFIAFLLAILLVVGAFTVLMIYVAEGVNGLVVEAEEETEQILQFGIQGHLLTACLYLITIGVSTLLVTTKSRIKRNILSFAFPIILLIPFELMAIIADAVSGINTDRNIFYGIENLPLSWLWLAIIAIISICIAVLGVYKLIQHERPKDF